MVSRRRKKRKRLPKSRIEEKKETAISSFGLALRDALRGSRSDDGEKLEEAKRTVSQAEGNDDIFSKASRAISRMTSQSKKAVFPFVQYERRKPGCPDPVKVRSGSGCFFLVDRQGEGSPGARSFVLRFSAFALTLGF